MMSEPEATEVKEFWDKLYETSPYSQSLTDDLLRAVTAALQFCGDIRGKRVADLGCGGGTLSLYLAEKGAEVHAIDISEVVIQRLQAKVQSLGITNVHPVCGDISNISADHKFDVVIGSMILHHIEPFEPVRAASPRFDGPGRQSLLLREQRRESSPRLVP